MKAWRVYEAGEPEDVLQLEDVPIPEPSNNEVLIKTGASALNFPDVLLCRGIYQWQPDVPFTPGLEVSGEIIAVGPNSKHQVGDRVYGGPALPGGGFSEYTVLRDDEAFDMPSGMTEAEAAGFYITYQTAHVGLLRRAALLKDETLLVHAGAGGVGSAAIQLGVSQGARVIACAGGPEKTALCARLGADVTIDYERDDVVQHVRELTEGRGADVIWDPVGGWAFEFSRRCVAFEGRIVLVGFASGDIPRPPLGHVLVKNYSLLGMHWGLYRRRDKSLVRRVHQELSTLFAAGSVRPYVSEELDFAELPEALCRLAHRKTVGKVVIRSPR